MRSVTARPVRFADRMIGVWCFAYVMSIFVLTPVPGLSSLTFIVLGGLGISLLLRGRRLRIVQAVDTPMLLALAFGIMGLGSVLWAPYALGAAINAASALAGILGGVLVYLALQNGMLYGWVAWGAAVGGGVEAVVAMRDWASSLAFRSAGLTGNANLLGFLLAIAALLLLAWPRRPRGVAVLAVLFVLVGSVVSGSRTVLLVWPSLGLLGLWHLMKVPVRVRAWVIVGIVATGATVAVGVARSATIHAGLEGLFVLRRARNLSWGGDNSIMERVEMVREAAVLWSESPVWGHGIGQYRFISTWNTYSHNNYMEILVGLGVVGLLCYVGQHGVMIYRAALENRLADERFQVAFVALTVLLLWDIGTVSYYEKSTWLLLGVLWFLCRRGTAADWESLHPSGTRDPASGDHPDPLPS